MTERKSPQKGAFAGSRLAELIKRTFSEDDLVCQVGETVKKVLDEDGMLFVNGKWKILRIKCSKAHERELLFSEAGKRILMLQFVQARIC